MRRKSRAAQLSRKVALNFVLLGRPTRLEHDRMAVAVGRFDVFQVGIEPTIGSKIQKSRPCLIISPDEMNRHIKTVNVAPMTKQRILKNSVGQRCGEEASGVKLRTMVIRK
jgi:hypothetical protein